MSDEAGAEEEYARLKRKTLRMIPVAVLLLASSYLAIPLGELPHEGVNVPQLVFLLGWMALTGASNFYMWRLYVARRAWQDANR